MAFLFIQRLVSPALDVNAYLVADPEERRAVAIDPGFAGQDLLARCADREWKLDAVILTHGHIDHSHDAAWLADDQGIPICAHPAEEALLSDPIVSGARWLDLPFVQCKVTRKLNEGDEIEVGRGRLSVLHTPGHSPGSISLLGEQCCFTGDLIFAGGVGRWDLPGGDAGALADSARRVAQLCDDRVTLYPGHGEQTTMGKERALNPSLREWL